MQKLEQPISIIGIEIRTTNENLKCAQDIPPLWERFFKENCMEKIENKLDQDIFAVYTHFENEGKNNNGMYSVIIGCQTTPDTIAPSGFTKIQIPQGKYHVFPVEEGRQDKVGDAWFAIWSIPQSEKTKWNYTCEF